ncbi:MAG: HNH endonuclease [Deltaproteobacteria bacterium]|nr:HNH endonuclease [Deltaproteobacteria bacterium]
MGAPVELSNGDPRVRPDVAGHSASTHTSCATETIDPVRRRAPTARLRLQVLDRDSFRCVLCGRSPALERGAILHIDHVIPFSRGGPATLDNLRTLCQRCNLGRGNAMSLGHPLAQDKS